MGGLPLGFGQSSHQQVFCSVLPPLGQFPVKCSIATPSPRLNPKPSFNTGCQEEPIFFIMKLPPPELFLYWQCQSSPRLIKKKKKTKTTHKTATQGLSGLLIAFSELSQLILKRASPCSPPPPHYGLFSPCFCLPAL